MLHYKTLDESPDETQGSIADPFEDFNYIQGNYPTTQEKIPTVNKGELLSSKKLDLCHRHQGIRKKVVQRVPSYK